MLGRRCDVEVSRACSLQLAEMMDPRTFTRIARDATFHDAGHGFDVFGLSPPALANVVELSAPLCDRYLRVDSDGIENVPTHGAAILVGGTHPIDAAVLCLDVLRKLDPPRIPRPIADRGVRVLATLFARIGVVSGTAVNLRYLLDHAELVAMPTSRLTCAAEHAIRHRTPVIPVAMARHRIRYGAPLLPHAPPCDADDPAAVVAYAERIRRAIVRSMP